MTASDVEASTSSATRSREAAYEWAGECIRLARLAAGFRHRKDLAAHASLSERTVADIELGRLSNRQSFSRDAISLIEIALNWPAGTYDACLAGEEPPTGGPQPEQPDEIRGRLVLDLDALYRNPRVPSHLYASLVSILTELRDRGLLDVIR